MAKDPAVLFYPNDFIASTFLWTSAETGVYIRLLCYQQINGHITSNEFEKLCEGFDKVKSKFVKDEDGLYYNERMEREILKRFKYVNALRENGAKGGRPSTKNQLDNLLANQLRNRNRNKDIIKDNRGRGEEEKEEERQNTPNKGTSKAFIPPTLEEVREYARSKDCEDIAERFYEYFTDGEWKDSAGKPVRSWKQKLLTWRNKEPAKNKPPDNKPMKYGTFDPTEALNNAIRRTFEYPKRGADNGS